MKRHPIKSITLFMLFFVLSTFTISAIFVRQAVINTDINLRRMLPTVATITQDTHAINNAREISDEPIIVEPVTSSIIHEIGNLDYVRMFDYTTWSFNFFSNNIYRVFDPQSTSVDNNSLRQQGFNFEQFTLKGVNNPYVADIEGGLINLISGRTFTEDEIDSGIFCCNSF